MTGRKSPGLIALHTLGYLLLLGASVETTHAQSIWNHNGSSVRLEAAGTTRRFYYVEPRSGHSAKEGDLLFEGQKNGNTYSGSAFVFSTKCGPARYAVSGDVSQDQTSVTLYGKTSKTAELTLS